MEGGLEREGDGSFSIKLGESPRFGQVGQLSLCDIVYPHVK